MPHLVAAKMVGTAGGATRASASAAAVEFASWCSRRSAEPPSSSASEGRLPSPAAPAGDPPVQRASSPDVTVPVASALSVHASQSRAGPYVCATSYAKAEPKRAYPLLDCCVRRPINLGSLIRL